MGRHSGAAHLQGGERIALGPLRGLARSLQRRGFAWGVTYKVISKLILNFSPRDTSTNR